ncbi:MAG: phosphodiester glycosidase family protein [Myxococcaceae bacterium]|jgi:hypothetical protein|nr:phosphodiester glycosidase family protein [Myxococcaceae bacterium]MCA3012896.1 phosphodiester glycosidase family protein [Myxococcaceae bacterium]
MVRRNARVPIRLVMGALLAALAWIAWNPQAIPSPLFPVLVDRRERHLHSALSVQSGRVLGTTWQVTVIPFELSRLTLSVSGRPGGGRLADLVPARALAAVNGTFFEPDFTAHGWLVVDGVERSPRRQTSPHHVFALHRDRAFIGRWEQLDFEPTLAFQNFPLLVEEGRSTIRRTEDDPGHPRTLVCEPTPGVVALVVILPGAGEAGPSLFETGRLAAFPRLLGGLGCRAALNLDGGPSTGFWLAGDPPVFVEPQTTIANVLAILPP